MDESMMTPYGPPNPYCYVYAIPNDCVGLLIGKGGETIRNLQVQSGAKVQVARKEVAGSETRNVFIEGPADRYEAAVKMIEEIVMEAKRI